MARYSNGRTGERQPMLQKKFACAVMRIKEQPAPFIVPIRRNLCRRRSFNRNDSRFLNTAKSLKRAASTKPSVSENGACSAAKRKMQQRCCISLLRCAVPTKDTEPLTKQYRAHRRQREQFTGVISICSTGKMRFALLAGRLI